LRSLSLGTVLMKIVGIGLLLCVCAAAQAQQACQIDEAQRLFGQQPRPVATIAPMLEACAVAGSTDYRVYMFQGVMARDAGDRPRAMERLKKAREVDPKAINPALELGFTLELEHGAEARQVYEQVLQLDPSNRAALLGLGRVARGQNRLDEARAIYQRLLAANPKDVDALNGMAWLALADRKREQGRTGFEQVLALEPGNEEAKIGLSKAEGVYRYTFDANGGFVSTASGNSWGFGGRGEAGITAFDTLQLGWMHYTNELQTLSAIGVSVLPSDTITVGYSRLVPLSYAVSLTYDYRGHRSLPTEHWIDGGVTIYMTDWLRWFGGYRQMFGSFQYDGRLIRTGLSASLSDSWQVSATFYDAAQAIFNNYQEILSWVFDVTWYGPRNMLVVAGVGYSPLINNVDLHARTILPVTDRVAVQLIVGHNSINYDTRATVGLRFTW
jgi:cytochrome c-type biogenesis protein CcmH/NrfG